MANSERDELSRASIEILESTGLIIERLQPEIIRALGDIAARGATPTDQESIDKLADAADRAQDALSLIYEAINKTTPYLEVKTPAAPEVVEDTGQGEEAVDLAAALTPAADEAEQSSSEQGAEETQEDKYDFDRELMLRLGMSPNEQAATILALDHLKQDSERHGFRDIIRAAFGQSRLKRVDENKFTEILDMFSRHGVLRRYGKSFASGSKYEYLTDETRTEDEKPLNEVEIGIIEYLASQIDEQTQAINIGQIIRKHLGIEELPPDEHQKLIQLLNSLAARGYLSHEERTPWYSLGERPAVIDLTISHQPITATALKTLEELTGLKPVEETVLIEKDQARAETPAAETEAKVKGLEGLAKEVFEYAQGRDFFRMEELHRGVASLSGYKTKDKEYLDFKGSFASIREQIVEALKAQRVDAHWEEAGRNRGKKYKLVMDGTLKGPATTDSVPSPGIIGRKEEIEAVEPEVVIFERPKPVARPLSPREQKIKFRRDSYFAERLGAGVFELLSSRDNGRDRLVNVSREVAQTLNVSVEEARSMLDELVSDGLFHNGNEEGYKMISTEALHSNTPRISQEPASERNKPQWTVEDTDLAVKVLDRVASVRYFEQGIQPKDLARELEVEEDRIKALLRRMDAGKYLLFEHKARATRGGPKSRRTSIMIARFGTQAAKNRYRDEREEIIAEIKSLVEAESQPSL